MNVSNANLQVSVNVTQTMDTNMPMSQPPPLIRRRSVDPSKQVDEDIVCIDSDSEDTPSVTHTMPNSAVSYFSNNSRGKMVTLMKDGRIFKIMIPGMGPLKIKVDPVAKYKQVNPAPTGLRPFSLNFDDIHRQASYLNANTVSVEQKFQPSPGNRSANKTSPKNSITKKVPGKTDKFCFTPYQGITNNFGFGHMESHQSKKCLSTLNALMRRLNASLNKKKKELKKLTSATKRNRQVKTVPISKIVGAKDIFHWSGSSDNESVCNSSLLITKKVVILNGGEEHDTNRKVKRPRKPKSKTPAKKLEATIRPCYVKLIKDSHVEKIYRNSISKMENHVYNRSSKKSLNISEYIIDTEQKFRNHIAYIKPVTVINENNYRAIKNYKEEFCRTNIVFPYKDGLPKTLQQDTNFIVAVSDGYVKLVDDELLCSYFLRELVPEKKR
ncbi:unnamed protein product [Acanthoscelides obtectus]|uniref:Uncharacterized protein n=1 Tax=Acanthoscelides obtectus TaxID=200917 RepID=A0A9P0JZP4_ACAOB|nr:unnamed protein product [Acanthoscelides obtectus]CAK1663412.1 hypothetical protein AOBTE_LOCUS23658 [Acanthoscelides obtectus]